MAKKIFITGTGTDIGKTFVAGLITKKLKDSGINAAYYKAAMSGNDRRADGSLIPGDGLHVKNISGIDQTLEEMCPYVYETAVSPHLASRIEGNPVKLDVVKKGFDGVCSKYDYVTVEGSGGIACPICFDEEETMLEDVIKGLGLSCIIVANAGLGTINDVVLTYEYMKSRNIAAKGIIFNYYHPQDAMEEDNLRMCEHLTGVKVIACVKEGDKELDIDAEYLASLYE